MKTGNLYSKANCSDSLTEKRNKNVISCVAMSHTNPFMCGGHLVVAYISAYMIKNSWFHEFIRYISPEPPFLNFEPKIPGSLVHVFFSLVPPPSPILILVYQKHQRGPGKTIETTFLNFEPKLSSRYTMRENVKN